MGAKQVPGIRATMVKASKAVRHEAEFGLKTGPFLRADHATNHANQLQLLCFCHPNAPD